MMYPLLRDRSLQAETDAQHRQGGAAISTYLGTTLLQHADDLTAVRSTLLGSSGS